INIMDNNLNRTSLVPHFAIILILVVLISSCEDMININPKSSDTAKNFYKTEKEFNQAVIGLYSGLQSTRVTSIFPQILLVQRTGNTWQTEITTTSDQLQTTRFTVKPTYPILDDAWESLYNVIRRANLIL